MSNPLHLRQSLFALQARMKVIELHTWQNVQCKAGRLVWNYDRSSSPIVQPARSATKLWTTVRLGRTRMQRFTKLPLFVRTSPTFWVMLHGTLRHAPTPRRKVCAEWQHAACGLFPGHAGFGNHEGSKVYCWNRSWAEIKATAVRGTRQYRFACRWWASTERMGFRKLASKAWHIIVLVECFLAKSVNQLRQGDGNFPSVRGPSMRNATSCEVAASEAMASPLFIYQLAASRSNACLQCQELLWQERRHRFVVWCGIVRILEWKSEGRPRLVSPWSMAHSSRIVSKKKKGPARQVPVQ